MLHTLLLLQIPGLIVGCIATLILYPKIIRGTQSALDSVEHSIAPKP